MLVRLYHAPSYVEQLRFCYGLDEIARLRMAGGGVYGDVNEFRVAEDSPSPLGEGGVRSQDLDRLETLTRRFAAPSPRGYDTARIVILV